MLALLRGAVVTGGRRIDDGVVEVLGDRIGRVGPATDWPESARPAPTGHTLLPGLVDVHCHGGAGHGFPEADADGVRAAVGHHRAHGTTTLLGSLVSAPPAVLARRVDVLAPLVAQGLLAGIHLEGPFLSAARCGAQDPAVLRPGDPALLRRLLDRAGGTVASMTLAPETAHYPELLAVLAAHGVVPSLGHTDATARVTAAAIRTAIRAGGPEAGSRVPLSATHLFNGMPPLHHRAPGPVAACLAAAGRGEMVLELVADGVHLDDATVAMVFDLVGPERIALVTDAMAAAGMPDGRYPLGALAVDVVAGVARVAPNDAGTGGSLAGGTTRMIDLVRRAVRHGGVDLPAAVRAASATPAALLGLDHDRGDLAPGLRADVVVTDDDLEPVAVLHAGTWTGPRTGTAVPALP